MAKSKNSNPKQAPIESINNSILLIRDQRVMLDFVLASLYGVETKALKQAVRRNIDRFPDDFMFQLTNHELSSLRSQIVTLKTVDEAISITAESKAKRGQHIKYLPYAFTEQGIAMLSSVLRSPQAVKVNIEIMRAFVRLHTLLESNKELALQLSKLEQKYDAQFKAVFDVIREMMKPPETKKRPIGFAPWKDN